MATVNVDLRLMNRQFMQGLRQTNQSISTTQIAIGGLVANLATGALSSFASAASGAFRSVFRSAVNIERTGAQFRALVGDADGAREALERVTRFAADTPFETADVERAGVQLLAFGTRAEDLTTRLMELGNVAGVSNRNIGEIATIFGQINAQGRLTAERLNQLTDAGINLNNELASELNISVSELRDAISAGAVSADVFNTAFQNLGNRLMGTAALSMTLGGAISAFNSQVEEATRLIGVQLAPVFVEVTRDLTAFIMANREAVSSFGLSTYMLLRDAYVSIRDAISSTNDFIDEFVENNQGLINVLRATADAIGNFLTARLVEFQLQVEAITFVLEPFVDVLGDALRLALANVNRLFQVFTRLTNANSDAIANSGDNLLTLRNIIQNVSDFFRGLIGVYDLVSDAAFRFTLGVIGFFTDFSRNVQIIWNNIMNVITAAFVGIVAAAQRFYAGFLRALAPIEGFVRRLFASVVENIREPIRTVIDGLVDIINNLLNLPLLPFRDQIVSARDALMGASNGLRTFDTETARTNNTLTVAANNADMAATMYDNLAASIQNAEQRTVSFGRAPDPLATAAAPITSTTPGAVAPGMAPRTTPRTRPGTGTGGVSLGGPQGDGEPTIGGGSAQAALQNEILRMMQEDRLEIIGGFLTQEMELRLRMDVERLQQQEDFTAAQARIDEAAAQDTMRRMMDQFFQFRSIQQAQADFQRLTENQKVTTVQTGLSAIANLTRTESGAAFEIGKAAAKANAVIDTYRAANAAYASLAGIPIVGPALGVAAAAAAVVSGIRNVENINRQQPGFQLGGSVGGAQFSGDNVLIRTNSGESVLTRNQQGEIAESLNQQGVIDAINNLSARMNRPLVVTNANGIAFAEFTREGVRDGIDLSA